MLFYDMSNFVDTPIGYENECIGKTLEEAQEYIDSQPYEYAVINGYLTENIICDDFGNPIEKRRYWTTPCLGHVMVCRSDWHKA